MSLQNWCDELRGLAKEVEAARFKANARITLMSDAPMRWGRLPCVACVYRLPHQSPSPTDAFAWEMRLDRIPADAFG